MICLGFEPGAEEWKAQTEPLSYGGTPQYWTLLVDQLLDDFPFKLKCDSDSFLPLR